MTRPEHPALAGPRTFLEPAPAREQTRRILMHPHRSHRATALAVTVAVGLLEAHLFAQGVSPWLNAVDVLQQAFTGPLARGLSLIAIVIGGLMFAFGEGGSKKALAGIIFGLGMAMGAANFLTWLFS